jgi:HD-GYP domain-containing protein (c-di-GMP phosphodiesterase class II)
MNNIDEKFALLQHMSRVSELAYKMAKHMGLSERDSKEVAIAGHLHDVGKFFVHPDILNKTNKLTREELAYVQEHVDFSFLVGHMMGNRLTPDILRMIWEHHENADGTGYPKGKRIDEVLPGSHIVKICDSYDAMRSDRPYRKALTAHQAIEEILNHKEQYDDRCIRALIEMEGIYTLDKAI